MTTTKRGVSRESGERGRREIRRKGIAAIEAKIERAETEGASEQASDD